MKKSLLFVGIVLLGAQGFAAPVRAQNAVAPVSTEAEALALLDKSAKAYAALEGLSMKYRFFIEGAKISNGEGAIAFEKSGRARITSSIYPSKVNGPRVMGDAGSAKESLERAMGLIPSAASVPLSSLVQGKNPFREENFGPIGMWKNIRLLPDNGVAATGDNEGLASPTDDVDFALYLDPTDNLLRHVEVKARMEDKTFFQAITLSDIQINPQFAPDTFVLPPQAAPVPRKSDNYWDPKLKVGAAPYALQGVDLAKFGGKVVLLDFWATWCGPCVGEMPSVLKNYAKFHPKGFEIVGISLDESKKDLTEFVKARKVPWMQVFDGKGWKGANVAKYGVKGIPFTLLVGKDGKIAAINPRGEALEPALKLALSK